MRLIYISFLILYLILFTTSCSYFKRSNDNKVIYTVRLDKIDVKKSRDPNSKLIGVVHKGDTIIPSEGWNLYYISFNYKGNTGFVNKRFLDTHYVPNMTRASNMKLGQADTIIRDYLNNYVNWRKGKFWLIMLVLIIASIIFIKIGNKLEDYIYYNYDTDSFKYNKLPYFSAIIGILFSIVYMFFRVDVLQAMFVTKFYWLPDGNSWLDWYLWLVSILGVGGILYFWIKDFIHYGLKGIVTIIYFTSLAIITFNVGLYGGIIALLFAIYWIVISLIPKIGLGSGSSSNKRTAAERLQYFYEQKERDEKE